MFKRWLPLALIAILVVSALAIACATTSTPTATPTPTAKPTTTPTPTPTPTPTVTLPLPEWPKQLAIAASGTDSVKGIIGAAMAAHFHKYLKLSVTPLAIGGHFACVSSLAKGETQLAIIGSEHPYTAWRGLTQYAGKPVQVRALAAGFRSWYHTFATAKSGIKTMYDLRGKILYGSSSGSLAETQHKAYLRLYGIDPDKDMRYVNSGSVETSIAALREGRCDAIRWPHEVPSAVFAQLCNERDLVWVEDDKSKLEQFLTLPDVYGYFIDTIKGGPYKGMDPKKDLPVLAYGNGLCSLPDLPDSLAYWITKIILEPPYSVEWGSYHALCKDFDIGAFEWFGEMPIHPGTIKYLKEIGAWTDAWDKRNKAWLAEVGLSR